MGMDRRNFLKATGIGAGAIGAAAISAGTLPTAVINSATASDPIARNGTAKFKYSLAAYSYRDLLTGDNAKLTMEDFIRDCADFGLEGAELTSYYFPEPPTATYLHNLKALCFRLGLSVSGTAIRNDFGFPEGPERKEQIASVKRWIDHAEILGAPVIRIFAGKQKEGVKPAQSHSLMVSAIEECCEYAGQHGIFLALENHGGPTATAEGLLKFVRDVQSDWFGVNLDSGNFHETDDIYGELEKIAPYALNAQVKVVVSGPDKEKKPTDFKKIAAILTKSAYRGFVVLEFEEEGDPREQSRKYLDEMRAAFEA